MVDLTLLSPKYKIVAIDRLTITVENYRGIAPVYIRCPVCARSMNSFHRDVKKGYLLIPDFEARLY